MASEPQDRDEEREDGNVPDTDAEDQLLFAAGLVLISVLFRHPGSPHR